MDAVAAGPGAHVDDRVAHAAGLAVENLVAAGDAEAQHVDQGVETVGIVEVDFAAHGGDADAVAVAGDPGHHAVEQEAVLGVQERSEPERVEAGDGPGAHGEDVPDDAAHAGGGALVRLDERGVVVRLDLEHGRLALADVHHAGILAGPLDHARPPGGQAAQVHPRAFVAAVLRPHDRKDAEFGQGGRAPQRNHDALVLRGGEVVLLDEGGGDGLFFHAVLP